MWQLARIGNSFHFPQNLPKRYFFWEKSCWQKRVGQRRIPIIITNTHGLPKKFPIKFDKLQRKFDVEFSFWICDVFVPSLTCGLLMIYSSEIWSIILLIPVWWFKRTVIPPNDEKKPFALPRLALPCRLPFLLATGFLSRKSSVFPRHSIEQVRPKYTIFEGKKWLFNYRTCSSYPLELLKHPYDQTFDTHSSRNISLKIKIMSLPPCLSSLKPLHLACSAATTVHNKKRRYMKLQLSCELLSMGEQPRVEVPDWTRML